MRPKAGRLARGRTQRVAVTSARARMGTRPVPPCDWRREVWKKRPWRRHPYMGHPFRE